MSNCVSVSTARPAPTTLAGIYPFTVFCCGTLTNLEEDCYNEINCCTLPITTERQTLDMGTIDDICD